MDYHAMIVMKGTLDTIYIEEPRLRDEGSSQGSHLISSRHQTRAWLLQYTVLHSYLMYSQKKIRALLEFSKHFRLALIPD